MIYATINGKKAYPKAGVSIKLVLENPFVKQQGNHTYQVSFPLDITENRQAFGNVNRIDVSRRSNTFNNCALFIGSRCLLRGSATVVSFSDGDIKLQFLGTSSDAMSKWGDIYIDSLEYPEIGSSYKTWCKKTTVDVPLTVVTQGWGGERGKYVFFTVVNETTGKKYNRIRCYGSPLTCKMKRSVLQPSLIYVLHQVFNSMGYTVENDVYDTSPWNELYIVNVKRTAKIAGALPHWKISTFLEEFRKLFNAVYIYDETAKSVRIESYASVKAFGSVAPECEPEFSSEYDEDGISYLGSNNIAYGLVSCSDQKYAREIPKEVLNSFDVAVHDTLAEALSAAGAMTVNEKMTTLFLAKNAGYLYFRKDEQENIGYQVCGFFTPLIKEGNTTDSNTTELKIIPAPMGDSKVNESEIDATCMMPCVEGPEWGPVSDEEKITTLQDVLEEDVSVEEDSEDEKMPIAFLAAITSAFYYNGGNDRFYAVLRSLTDRRESGLSNACSMALAYPGNISEYIGKFHSGLTTIDAKNQYVIKFISDEIPDQRKVYIFWNKQFLCAKIEINITESGFDSMMTGYFYEILS